MDNVQRLILINQYRILGEISRAQKQECDQAIAALEGGYEEEVNALIHRISLNIVTAGQCHEVKAILNMYRHMQLSIMELNSEDATLAREDEWVHFKGFDATEEPDQYGYASYLLEKCGQWREIYDPVRGLNAGIRTLDKYRAMLEVYETFDQVEKLSMMQLKDLSEA